MKPKSLPKLNRLLLFKYMLSFFILLSARAQARIYYVAASGNNSNTGLSATTPWQTISKVNSFFFSTNDSILFKRGDIFYGGIVVRRANLNYGAYGTGDKPVISGLSTVTGWVSLGGNIWEAPLTNVKSGVNLVLRDGTIQQVGRFPNADAANGGYLTYTASTKSSITGPALSTTTNWTGAEIAIRLNRWDIIRQRVIEHSGGLVTFTTNLEKPRLNYGYFFQRDSRTLDIDGEWWHNVANNKLRMYFSSNNPGLFNTEIATIDTLFSSLYGSLTISNLSFKGSGKKSIWVNGGSGVTIKDCDVNNSGAEAISTGSTANVTVDNCTTTNSLGSGIRLINLNSGDVNLVVQNCTVFNTALLAGMETSNENNGGGGIKCYGGSKVTVQYNRVINSGYVGIAWQGNNVNVKYNFINLFCLVRDDGGGIYTVEKGGSDLPIRTNRNIISNILLYGTGNNYGTSDAKGTSARGLYFDLGTRSVLADSNTVAYMEGGGFHGNNNGGLTITNNVFYSIGKSYSMQRFADAPQIRNMVITKNIVYPYRFEYRNLGINTPVITKEADISAMGNIDSNYYSLKSGLDTSLLTVTTNADNSNYQAGFFGFAYLTGTIGIEKNSKNFGNNGTFEYNDSNTPKVVSFSGLSKKDVYGNVYNNNVTIPVWSSKVLLPNGLTPVANSGLDRIITLPTNSLTISGSGTDTDGTITRYAWVKIAGPSAGTIAAPNATSTLINSLAAGVYQYELTVTDNTGASGKDTLQITVIGFANKSPIANAGIDRVITLPTNSLSLSGNGTDTDGTITNYEWTKISGAIAGTIASPATANTVLNGLVQGFYQFELKVTDNGGAIGRDTVQVTVNAQAVSTTLTAVAIETLNCAGTNSSVNVTTNGGVSPYTGTGSFITNAGKGSLKVSFPAIVSTVQTNIYASTGNITAGKNYVLRFTTLGTTGNGQITVILKKLVSPFTTLAAAQSATFGTSVKEHQFFFTPTVSDAGGRFEILIRQNSGTTYFDNIAFIEATSTGELIGNNVVSGGQFETDISAIRFWSANNNQVMEWDNTSKTNNINYYTVTDAAGAKSTVGLPVKQSATLLTATVALGSSNILTVAASGGTMPYIGTGTFTAKVGLNTFIVTDANGCTATSSINITQLVAARVSTGSMQTAAAVINTDSLFNRFKISSFPNPTINEFGLFVEGRNYEKVKMLVLKEDGRIVFQTEGTTNKTYKFGAGFSSGIYIIKVTNGKDVRTIKVIKSLR